MSRKKERQKAIEKYWTRDTPNELDVIDKGDHLKVSSCNTDAAAWWLGTLRAVYPQDHYSGAGESIKMHPELGVTLKLNRCDGTLRIKGKKHLEWFRENFEQILEAGGKEQAAQSEMARCIDDVLRLDDGYSVQELLEHLPASGAFKHGPTYIYRLWRGLLDDWVGRGGDVYIVSPLFDARRLADILLILVKHRLTGSRVHLFTMERCDPDFKFPKMFREAKDLVKAIKGRNKNRLVAEERLKLATQRLDAKFGRFHCKLISYCGGDDAEVLLTSASFHKFHFQAESGDTVLHAKLTPKELINSYISPLGLAHQVPVDTPSPSESSMVPSEDPEATTPVGSQPPTPLDSPAGAYYQPPDSRDLAR